MSARRPRYVTPDDLALLDSLEREGSLAAAARRVGMSRDRAVYRVERLEGIAGGRIVNSRRGGLDRGTSRLTPRGAALRRRARAQPGPVAVLPLRSPAVVTRIEGRFHAGPYPLLRLAGGVDLAVGFRAREGSVVRVEIGAESVLLARHRFPTSARNVLRGIVERITPYRTGLARVDLTVGSARLSSLVTQRAISALALSPRSSVVAYVKATAIRREPASRRSSLHARGVGIEH